MLVHLKATYLEDVDDFFLSHHYVSTFSSFFLRSPHTPGCVKFALDLRLLGASPRWTIAKGAICSAGWEWKAGGSRLMGSEILGPSAFAKRGSSLMPFSVSSSQPGSLAQCHLRARTRWILKISSWRRLEMRRSCCWVCPRILDTWIPQVMAVEEWGTWGYKML